MQIDTTELFKQFSLEQKENRFIVYVGGDYYMTSPNRTRAFMVGVYCVIMRDLLEKGFKPVQEIGTVISWWFNPKTKQHATVYGAEYHIFENDLDAGYNFGRLLRHHLESEGKFDDE